MDKNRNLDNLMMYAAFAVVVLILVFYEPFLLTIFIPTFITAFIVFSSTGKEKNQYHKAQQALLLAVAFVGIIVMCLYFLTNSWFMNSGFNDYGLFTMLLTMVCFSFGVFWLSKRAAPVSFLEDDDRFVQETMYQDGDNSHSLHRAFAYRGVKFTDENGAKIGRGEVSRAVGKLDPVDLDIHDVETVALDERGNLKMFYQNIVIALFNDLIMNSGKEQDRLAGIYGYSFTINDSVTSEEEFVEALKSESLFYYKLYSFIKKDCDNPDIDVKFNFSRIYVDSFKCLEFTLMLMLHMLRQYMNFPMGDLGKYIKTTKDKNFFGALSSLPSDFYNVSSTSIAPSGIAYYYAYYIIHKERFANPKETIVRYVQREEVTLY